jgi:hypothetical protein
MDLTKLRPGDLGLAVLEAFGESFELSGIKIFACEEEFSFLPVVFIPVPDRMTFSLPVIALLWRWWWCGTAG